MFEIRSFDDYVDHLVEHAHKKGYRVSRRVVRNLLKAHFRQIYARMGAKQDIFIRDFILLVLRKDLFFKRRYTESVVHQEDSFGVVDNSNDEVSLNQDTE